MLADSWFARLQAVNIGCTGGVGVLSDVLCMRYALKLQVCEKKWKREEAPMKSLCPGKTAGH
eukprot:3542787-Pleurochrysis_carterae.AAC.3